MSDILLSTLRRRAQAEPELRPALLRARLRAGELTQGRLELAAYVGDADARAALGSCPVCRDRGPGAPNAEDPGYVAHCFACDRLIAWPRRNPTGLEAMVLGLARRTDSAGMVRAAVAAARVALLEWVAEECDGECNMEDRDCPRTRHAVRAIEAVEAWLERPNQKRWNARHVAYVEAGHLAWLPAPGNERALESIPHAAELAGEEAVRAAIRTALTAYALGT